jgi:hypothetical protein
MHGSLAMPGLCNAMSLASTGPQENNCETFTSIHHAYSITAIYPNHVQIGCRLFAIAAMHAIKIDDGERY